MSFVGWRKGFAGVLGCRLVGRGTDFLSVWTNTLAIKRDE